MTNQPDGCTILTAKCEACKDRVRLDDARQVELLTFGNNHTAQGDTDTLHVLCTGCIKKLYEFLNYKLALPT